MQHIGEAQLDIPAPWHNRSVNIYTAQGPGVAGLSVTVNREPLPFQTTLDDYVAQQASKLGQQLNGYALVEQTRLEVDGHPAHQLEFTWRTDDAGPVHQVLLCVAHGGMALSLAASHGGRMNEPQRLEAQRILHSLRFDAPPGTAADDTTTSPSTNPCTKP